jgi:hypothetical protein
MPRADQYFGGPFQTQPFAEIFDMNSAGLTEDTGHPELSAACQNSF